MGNYLKQENKNHWDSISEGYRSKVQTPFVNDASTARFVATVAPDGVAGTGIDIGCGNGYLLEALAQVSSNTFPTADLYGIDLSVAMIAQATTTLGTDATVMRADAADMPFADNQFDWIFAINVIIAVDRCCRVKCFAELFRTLSPQGSAIMLFPSLESYWEQLHVARELYITHGKEEQDAIWMVYEEVNKRLFDPIGGYITIENYPLRIKLYTQWELTRLLTTAGFSRMTVVPYYYSSEQCANQGLIASETGLFDWLVTAQK